MAFRAPPPKAHCFTFSAPTDSTADDIIDAIEEITGPRGLKSLQHQGGTKFCIAVATAAAAGKLSARGSFVLNGAAVPVAQVGPQVVTVTVFRCPLFVGDASLAAAFAQYGKVLEIYEQTFKGRQHVGNSLRVVRLEMSKPVPNFMSVQGHRVMCDYRGVTKVCSRCAQEGHVGKDCHTPRCARCETFGHDTTGCSAPCRRCAGEHATADCLQPRSYAAAVGERPAARGQAVATEGEARGHDTAAPDEAREVQARETDSSPEEACVRDWSTWADDASSSLPAERGTAVSTDAESLSGLSQVASTESESSGASTSHSAKASQSRSPSGAESAPSKPQTVKHTGSQVAAGRGHRTHVVDSPVRRTTTEPASTSQDQQPLSPISQAVKQGRDPRLRNPLYQLTDVLGQGDDMHVDKPDLKRPHHSSSSSADEPGNPRKLPATETSRPGDLPGPETQDL
ncbi:hypothetical protein HPB52_021072 [Rhipicephalus sanguineus]|uniref:CCHC-type domain-containing protein n=1 Tax=Rhipicephalus sanguineus TaxID=34632 RepID=A0A9D4PXL7_RHISA|nr:hypothetical protein HPB52_021072 [Rhipicephalus sanguineus]